MRKTGEEGLKMLSPLLALFDSLTRGKSYEVGHTFTLLCLDLTICHAAFDDQAFLPYIFTM
jgi:hypothetical protein